MNGYIDRYMDKGLPLHFIPVPGARPWKTRALGGALSNVPPGMLPAVLTAGGAQPSYGLIAFLKAVNVAWVRPTADGDGVENALVVPPGAAAPLISGSVAVTGSVLHPAGHSTRIGAYTQRMLEPFGVRPVRAGAAEPLAGEWHIDALTDWFQARIPWSALIFAGRHVTGLLTAVRTETGVVESFDALISTAAPVGQTMRDAAIAQAAALRSMDFSMDLHFGADALGVHSGADGYRVPVASVLGPDLAKIAALDPQDMAGVASERLGARPFQHLAVRFPLVTAWDEGRGQALRQGLFPAR